jgi:hypothetical protein
VLQAHFFPKNQHFQKLTHDLPARMDVFSFARFAHYYPRCCMMFPTKFPQSSLLTGKWFLTMIQSNDPKIEGADACKSASLQLCSFIFDGSRSYGHLPKTQSDVSSSMSPIRGDVKKKILPLPLREGTDGGLHPAESQFRRGCGLAAYSGQARQLAVCTRQFHDAMVVRRLRFWKLRKQTRWL